MSGYVIGHDADLDVGAMWEYIAQDNVDAADRWIDKLFAAFDALAKTPGMGHSREDLTALPVLFWPVGGYLIIYRVMADRIEIIAVTRGERDIPTFLHKRTAS